MTTHQMPRKNATYRLDQRLIEEIQSLAKEQNTSSNRWLENALINLLKVSGRISANFEPLGETRGGHKPSKDVLHNDNQEQSPTDDDRPE